MSPETEPRVDRAHFTVATLRDADDSMAYWLSRPVGERLQGIELLRQTFYGHSATGARLQRVLELAQLDRR